jgi:hypothetical protein
VNVAVLIGCFRRVDEVGVLGDAGREDEARLALLLGQRLRRVGEVLVDLAGVALADDRAQLLERELEPLEVVAAHGRAFGEALLVGRVGDAVHRLERGRVLLLRELEPAVVLHAGRAVLLLLLEDDLPQPGAQAVVGDLRLGKVADRPELRLGAVVLALHQGDAREQRIALRQRRHARHEHAQVDVRQARARAARAADAQRAAAVALRLELDLRVVLDQRSHRLGRVAAIAPRLLRLDRHLDLAERRGAARLRRRRLARGGEGGEHEQDEQPAGGGTR